MGLVSFPPTSATFLVLCAKPEAFTGNPSANPPVPGMATATIDSVLRAEGDRAVRLALSDRIQITDVVTLVDEGFQLAIVQCTARSLMGQRGYNPKVGADQEIVDQAKRGDDYLSMMAPGAGGANGKRVTPGYQLASASAQQDSIRIRSSQRADDWARSRSDPRGRG